ncbi:high affinity 3',5'-cyclic-AMP phosphodiesterase 7A-like isoform X1 [Branchiostoma lanceolatum]|uniref:high affinity 3',5'-cyclic-AMP phosphodiesterase 7A-like isoform X1 n=1 Tax=Branchiostoma lanceolatum TaxID=7740 RepID=UPI003456C831
MEIWSPNGRQHQDLPVLPLDRNIPDHVLARRGAISFSSSTGGSTFTSSVPVLQRRGGISFDRTDKNALYIRMLGDVRTRSKPDLGKERRRSSFPDIDYKTFEECDDSPRSNLRSYTHRWKRRRRWLNLSLQTVSLLDEAYSGQARHLLTTVTDWDFDIFMLDKLTNGRSLFHLSIHLFQHHNLIQTFNLDIVKLTQFISLVEENYNNNPYHNALHAADVTQAMHCFLRELKLAARLTPLEVLSAVVAAITHDLDHPGVNQEFLRKTGNYLAALYNNHSVLEHHHWRGCVALLRTTGLLNHLSLQERQDFECQIQSLILATDISRQNEFVTSFKQYLDKGDLKLHLPASRHFTLQIALKCADVSNPCRTWKVSRKWSERVTDEFHNQGDQERKHKVDIANSCDRYRDTISRIQTGFIQFIVEPLYVQWERFSPTRLARHMINHLRVNKQRWNGALASELAEAEAAAAALAFAENQPEDVEMSGAAMDPPGYRQAPPPGNTDPLPSSPGVESETSSSHRTNSQSDDDPTTFAEVSGSGDIRFEEPGHSNNIPGHSANHSSKWDGTKLCNHIPFVQSPLDTYRAAMTIISLHDTPSTEDILTSIQLDRSDVFHSKLKSLNGPVLSAIVNSSGPTLSAQLVDLGKSVEVLKDGGCARVNGPVCYMQAHNGSSCTTDLNSGHSASPMARTVSSQDCSKPDVTAKLDPKADDQLSGSSTSLQPQLSTSRNGIHDRIATWLQNGCVEGNLSRWMDISNGETGAGLEGNIPKAHIAYSSTISHEQLNSTLPIGATSSRKNSDDSCQSDDIKMETDSSAEDEQ